MNDWRLTTLGEVARIVGGGTPSTREPAYWGGSVVWLTPTEVVKADGHLVHKSERMITEAGLAGSSATLLPKGAVLLTSRASVGYVALTDCALATNQGFQSLIPGDEVLSRYLMYWVQGHRDAFRSRASGSTFPEISKKKVAAIPITIPPILVQRRIGDVIAAIDSHIEALDAERRAIETVWATIVSNLDAEVERVPLGSVLVRIDAGKSPTGEERQPGPGERAVLKVSAVERGRFNPVAVKTVHPSVHLPDAIAVRRGDVLLVRSNGVLSRVGQVCQVRIEPVNLYLCDKTLRLVANPDRLVPDYLCHVLSSPASRQQIEALTGGSHMRNISQRAIRELEIPLLDLDQQSQISAALTSCLELSEALRAEGDAAARLRKGLLARLLAGNVEIPDSYDDLLEAAS
jgi:type I restriction enzyme, S subunit